MTLAKTALIAVMVLSPLQAFAGEGPNVPENESFEQYIKQSVVPQKILDEWLRVPSWGTFDPELGYVQGNSLMPWGIGNSATIETIQTNGARTSFMYADRKPRINTYGDSFTECEQVSDGETWQEYLAGHLGEPVANFGVGGYGVYQAYRRMLREEKNRPRCEISDSHDLLRRFHPEPIPIPSRRILQNLERIRRHDVPGKFLVQSGNGPGNRTLCGEGATAPYPAVA